MFVSGVLLIGLGLLYIAKPTLFRRGIWLKTSVAVRVLSEENYIKYMRGLGAALVIAGLGLALWPLFAHTP
jgi:hypothetical protein